MTSEGQIQGASVSSSIINTINTIIGAGMLVLCYSFRTDSILLGSFILILAALGNGFGMYLQGLASKFLPQSTGSFFTVCMITYPQLSVLFDLSIALQCFGVGISYIVLTGDLMPLVFPIPSLDDASVRLLYIALSSFLTVPLCYLKKLDSLKYSSIVCLVAIVYLVVLVYWNFFVALATGYESVPIEKQGEISWFVPQGVKPIFKTFAIIVLAYTCPNQFSIVAELEQPTLPRIFKITTISMTITAFLFWTVALCGYLTFGNYISGNIILTYDDSFSVQLGRGLLNLMVLLSYPLMFHPARISINNIYHWIKLHIFHKHDVDAKSTQETQSLLDNSENTIIDQTTTTTTTTTTTATDENEDTSVPLPHTRFLVLTTGMIILSYLIALRLKSFEFILSLVGATGGVLISFVLPGCYGYKLIDTQDKILQEQLIKNSPDECNNPIFRNKSVKYASLALTIWGICIMIICLYSTLFD